MAIKIATRLTMSKANLAKALVAKTTPLYAKETTYGPYNYERDIYPQARLAFPKYNIYNTNEDFTKYFVRDLNRKDLQLLKQIEVGAEENQISADQSNQETGAEQISAAQQTPTTGPSGGGMPSLPSTPVIHNVPQINLPGKPPEEPIGPATAKIDRLNAQQAAQNTRPSVVPGPTKKTFNFPAFKSSASSNFRKIQSFASPAGPFLKTNLSRITEGLKGMAGGMGKAITGPGLTKIANLGGRAGLGTINHGGNFLNNLSNTKSRFSAASRSLSPKNLGSKRVAWIFAGIFFLIFFMGLFGGLTGTPPGETAPLPIQPPNPGGGGDIANCKFTRRGASFPIPSNTLKQLFQEVANKTGVPAAVLAGVAAHESAVFTFTAKDDHDAFFNRNFSGVDCEPHFATSPTGALGLMQVQTPPNLKPVKSPSYNPNAVSIEGIKLGLTFLNRDLDSLTTMDFCDVRTNIYLGAGVLISKNGGKPPTTPDEIASSVCGYYGQCTYDGYNYGEEVKQDFLNCQAATPPSGEGICPIPNSKFTCGPSKPNLTYYSACQGGHCAGDYGFPSYCASYPSTFFATDIAGAVNQEVIMPNIMEPGTDRTHKLNCSYVGPMQGSRSWQVINQFKCTDDINRNVWVQFHHLQPNYNIPVGTSVSTGDKVGSIATDPGGPHTHVQIGINGGCGSDTSGCVPADQYLKCNK